MSAAQIMLLVLAGATVVALLAVAPFARARGSRLTSTPTLLALLYRRVTA